MPGGENPPRRRVAVTGGSGFLGAAIARGCAAAGHAVVTIDARDSPTSAMPGIIADIRDSHALEAAFVRHRIDTVVHGAAVVGVADVAVDLVAATSVNVVGAAALLTAASRAGVQRIIDLSSEEIYGAARGPVDEDAPRRPVTAYGAHKLATETLAATVLGEGYVAARLAWVYGSGFPRRRPPQPWLEDAAGGRTSPPSEGGDHLADLIHVTDVVAAILALIAAGPLAHSAYNVASGVAVPLREVAALLHAMRPDWHVDLGDGPLEGVASRGALSIARISEELSWAPAVPLEEGLRHALHGG